LDTSVFFHTVPAPATNPDWSSAAVMTGLGVLGAVLGGLLRAAATFQFPEVRRLYEDAFGCYPNTVERGTSLNLAVSTSDKAPKKRCSVAITCSRGPAQ
jgi:hypothetical protein